MIARNMAHKALLLGEVAKKNRAQRGFFPEFYTTVEALCRWGIVV
jgi:hypothetical protein